MTWDELTEKLYELYDGGPLNCNGTVEVTVQCLDGEFADIDEVTVLGGRVLIRLRPV